MPRGRKDNGYCLVDNKVNVARHGHGERRQYDDDCGAWNSGGGHLCSFPYVRTDQGALRRVFLCDGSYCVERQVNGVRTYEPFDPQPSPADVTTITRYYGMLNADPAFKKRVSWMDTVAGLSDVAVVEYRGVQPTAVVHGNSSAKTEPIEI